MKQKIAQFLRRTASDQTNEDMAVMILHLANVVEEMPEPEARRVKQLVPLVPYGNVTRAVWVCDGCDARIDWCDKYCRKCGRKIIEDGGC